MTIQTKAIEQHFPVVLFVSTIRCNTTFTLFNEILYLTSRRVESGIQVSPSQGPVLKRSTCKSNWNLEVLVFVDEKKTGKPGEKLSEKGENQQQLQPT